MKYHALQTSAEFRKTAAKALISIILFILTYIFLVLFAIGLTIGLGYLGFLLFKAYSHWFTGVFWLMLIGVGVVVLIFVFKFVFSRTEQEERNFIEISAADEPELFALIEEVVNQVGTRMPKRVYLSPEVNAGVFYDSLFLSMFLPVKMNLQIGMGVLNTYPKAELRAILAHEFGHFSQRSTRIGSYVHNANKVMYNLLYQNDNFERRLDAWAETISYVKFAVALGSFMIKGIQSVLKKVYEIVNINYYALSREMEHHADAVAATVAGSETAASSLLRLGIAEQALNVAGNSHEHKIKEGLRPLNLYPQQYFVMNELAMLQKTEIRKGLPVMDTEQIWKSTGTRIALTNPWLSHPDMDDRVRRTKALDIPGKAETGNDMAISLLVNKQKLQEALTAKMFEHHFVNAKAPELTSFEQFEKDFLNEYAGAKADNRYYGYYGNRLPYFGFDQALLHEPVNSVLSYNELFNDQGLTIIQNRDVLEADVNLLESINRNPGDLKGFRYDGVQYPITDCGAVIVFLKEQLEEAKLEIEQLDKQIFDYFKHCASTAGQLEIWKEKCSYFKQVAEATLSYQAVYLNLIETSAFMSEQTPFDVIREKMVLFKDKEEAFKVSLKEALQHPIYELQLASEQVEMFETYLAADWVYFSGNNYIDEDMNRIFTLLPVFYNLYQNTCIEQKKQFLAYQSSLFDVEQVEVEDLLVDEAEVIK